MATDAIRFRFAARFANFGFASWIVWWIGIRIDLPLRRDDWWDGRHCPYLRTEVKHPHGAYAIRAGRRSFDGFTSLY